jgi:hypothetical protein
MRTDTLAYIKYGTIPSYSTSEKYNKCWMATKLVQDGQEEAAVVLWGHAPSYCECAELYPGAKGSGYYERCTSAPEPIWGAGGHVVGTEEEVKAKEDREAPGIVGGMKGKIAGAGILTVALVIALGYLLLMGGKK